MNSSSYRVMRTKKSFRTSPELPLDLGSFQRFVERYHQSLYRYFAVHTSGDLVSAEAMTLKTFAILYGKSAAVPRHNFTSWLFGIAWDVLNAHESQKNLDAADVVTSAKKNGRAGQPTMTRTLKTLRALPFYPREAIYLRHFADLGTQDIAVLMEKSEANIQVLVYQGMTEFACRMENLEYRALPRKQVLPLAQSYHLYLDDLLAGILSQQEIPVDVAHVTHQLKALREIFSLKADARSQLISRMEQIYRPENSYTTRL